MAHLDIHAAILAGGQSRRYGSDKCVARLPGDSLTFLQCVISACRQIADRVVIIGHAHPGSSDDADDVIGDPTADAGPLFGLQTALRTCSAPYLLLAACDQPFLTGKVLQQLIDRRKDADLVMFAGDADGPYIFPSLMRTGTMLDVVNERIESKRRSLTSAFLECNTLRIVTIRVGLPERAALHDVDVVGDLPQS